MTMEDWSKRLDLFLMADDREILEDAGKITTEIAKAHDLNIYGYEKFLLENRPTKEMTDDFFLRYKSVRLYPNMPEC